MTRRRIIALLLMLVLAGIAAAQTSGGQMCVRAFEDRNGNGTQDGNEPPITRGLSAALIHDGVIIETALIENSQNASSGTLCFQRLEAGQYTMRVSSADYQPTTTNEFISVVSDTGIPVVFPYGGQLIPIEVAPSADEDLLSLTPAEQQSFLIRVVFGLIGAIVIMGAMAVVGAIIYFIFLRPSPQARYATGTYGAVPGTGSYAPVTDTGSFLAPTLDDTDQMKALGSADDKAYEMYEDTDLPQSRPTVAAPPNPYANTPDDDFSFEADDEDDPDSAFRPPQD